MRYQAVGTVIHVGDKEQVSEKFQKRDLVLRVDDQGYTQEIKFQAIQAKCDILNGLKAFEEIQVDFGIQGRKNQAGTDWFNSLTIINVKRL